MTGHKHGHIHGPIANIEVITSGKDGYKTCTLLPWGHFLDIRTSRCFALSIKWKLLNKSYLKTSAFPFLNKCQQVNLQRL